jgi:multidrug efflux pump subunit AcrA (membrane-fusion protein)
MMLLIAASPDIDSHRRLRAILLAAASLVTAACSRQDNEPKSPDSPPPPIVSVAEARRMSMPLIDTSLGTTFAIENVSIRAEVLGLIEERHVESGTHVRKGQLLFVIGAKRLRPELDDAKLHWAEAKAKPGRPLAGSESSIQWGRDDVTQPDTAAHAVESELNRFRVYAPIDGRVGAVHVQVGDLVRPGGVGRDSSELTTIEQRRVEIVPVKADFTHNRMRMIDNGIEPGQTVVVDGFSLIRSGSEVRCEFVNHPSSTD